MLLTISGADNNTNIESLKKLSIKYPFLEYGLLLSATSKGSPRYPDVDWLKQLFSTRYNFKLSFHLCGTLARDLLKGNFAIIEQLIPSDYPCVKRIQINLNGDNFTEKDLNNILNCTKFRELIIPTKTFDVCKLLLKKHNNGHKIACLYDISGGKGLCPNNYSIINFSGLSMGVAGGIKESNIDKVFTEIKDNQVTWLDVETGVRVEDDNFSFDKAEKLCQLVEKNIKK